MSFVPFTLSPLGLSAVSVSFGNRIDPVLHRQVVYLYRYLQKKPFPGLMDLVPAYASLGIFWDDKTFQTQLPTGISAPEYLEKKLQEILSAYSDTNTLSGRHWKIPVCYGGAYGPDLETMCAAKGKSAAELIRLHTETVYTVFMTGFRPGFPYMGIVPAALQMPRKASPRLRVPAGSVGIAGAQTGIYPTDGPGGWQIIGRTPSPLFNPDQDPPVWLQAGDTVQFVPVSDSNLPPNDWNNAS